MALKGRDFFKTPKAAPPPPVADYCDYCSRYAHWLHTKGREVRRACSIHKERIYACDPQAPEARS